MQKILRATRMSKKKHEFVLTDESVNGYGYRVLTSGIGREQFLKNPVMLYSHEYGLLPIGTWEDVREKEGKLMATAKFDEGDPFAQEVARKVDEGILRCCSIGFDVLGVDDSEELKLPGQIGPTVTKAELLECSICAIGANRNAMRLMEGAPAATFKVGGRMSLTMVQGGNGKKEDINPQNRSTMTEQEQNQMNQLQQQVQQLTESNQGLTQERDQARAELQAVRSAEIDALLSAAVNDGRISETERPQWKELMSVAPENAKAALAKLNTRTSLSQMLESQKGKGEFAGKSWKELDREGRLSAFKAADPESFKNLYRETFGAEYKE